MTSILSVEADMADTVPEKTGKLSLHEDWHSIKKIAGIPPECSMRLLPFFRPRSKKTEDHFSSEWQQASRRLDIAHAHTHTFGRLPCRLHVTDEIFLFFYLTQITLRTRQTFPVNAATSTH